MCKKLLFGIAAGLLCAMPARSATTNFDFNSNPSGLLNFSGSAVWIGSGGVGSSTNPNDGFLQITAAANSQRGVIIFDDFDSGLIVQGFDFEADLRIGNGTAAPADGFSVNYCRANDPVLTGGAFATGPNCEADLPEEGTQTGISVGFDAWDSGGPPVGQPFCNEADQSIGPDIVGVDIRVDGTLIKQVPMPNLNGTCADCASIQTGPHDGTGSDAGLCWAHLKVNLNTNGQLNVYWKGCQILTNYQTSYFPSPGRLVFAGRTGGANQNQEVDNIFINTIPATSAIIGEPTGYPDGFSIDITDQGSSVVNFTTVSARLNGSGVTPTSVARNGNTTTVLYHAFPTLFTPGFTNTVFISCQDTNGNTISGSRPYIVPGYTALPVSHRVAGVDTTLPGFSLLPWQSAGEPNAVWWMLEQLSGLHGANNAAFVTPHIYTGVINFNIAPASAGGGDAGNFRTNNGYADMLFPGIPGGNGLNGSTAENINCFFQFQNPGLYLMGVNSDDGFLVSEGPNPNDWFANWLGLFNGGRGSSDTTFYIAVTNAGIYPIRLAWENGNGELPGNGANLEWFTVVNGIKYLVNDPSPTNTSGVAAFYSGPQLPAFVSAVEPLPGSTGNRPDLVDVQITDVGNALVPGSARLYVNGVQKSPVATHTGQVTDIRLVLPASDLMPAGLNHFALTWNDTGANSHSNYWSFDVAGYVTLDPSQSFPLAALDPSQPGFTLKVVQVDPCLPSAINTNAPSDCGDGTTTQNDSANAMIAGLYFPWYGTNAADIWDSAHLGLFPSVTASTGGNMWYWSNVVDFNIVTSPGDFAYDYTMPGIPTQDGVAAHANNSIAASFDTYILFPTNGFFVMGVNSDDGFRLSEGLGVSRQVLHVTGTNVSRDVAAVPSTPASAGGSWQAPMPMVPLTAPIFYVDTSECPGPTTSNLTGQIALIDANRCGADGADGGYYTLVAMCQARGAVGVIVEASPGWGTPEVMGGGGNTPISIPAVHINGYDGEKDWFHTNGPLVATIGADTHLVIGEADYGKGMSHVDFGFVVPQAGLYPMHLIYSQGGGGAGLEWTSVATDGTRILINDAATPGALMAYRAVNIPTISIAKVGGTYQITFTGVLRSSSTANGTFNLVPGATSPYTIPTPLGPAQFYRASKN